MTREELAAHIRKLARGRSALLSEMQLDNIAAAIVRREENRDPPLWDYKDSPFIDLYSSTALDSLQREHPEMFATLPTANEFVNRIIEAGAALSPEEKLSLARSVPSMDPAELLSRHESLAKAIQARTPEPQPTSAIDRYRLKLKAEEAKRIDGNRAEHVEAERARMGDAEFNTLPPEQRLNIARKAQSNGG